MATRMGQAFVELSAKMDKLQADFAKAKAETSATVASMQGRLDSVNFSGVSSGLGSLASAATVVATAFAAITVVAGTIGTKFNQQVETSTVGIAALLSAQGKFRDSQGQELTGREKINAAIGYSSDLVKQLQVDNLKTTATFEELIQAFQVTLSPGMSAGLDVDQIKQYTLAMVQAAAAMGVPMNQMAEETRSLLSGNITSRNTRVATALGITNEDISKLKGDSNALFTFIMGKLQAFQTFGDVTAKSFTGMWSNVKDAISNALGISTLPFFNELKTAMGEFYNWAVKIDEKTGTIKLNPELISSFTLFNDTLSLTLGTLKLIGAAILAVGNGYTSIKSALPEVQKGSLESRSSVETGAIQFSTDVIPTVSMSGEEQTLVHIKELMASISQSNKTIAESKETPSWITGGDANLSLIYEWLAKINKEARQTELDSYLKPLEEGFAKSDALAESMFGSMEDLNASFKRSDEITQVLFGNIDKVSYGIDKAAMSADNFRKHLQDIGRVDLSNIGKDLTTKIVELDAKIKAAREGAKPAMQSSAAEYAKSQVGLDFKEYEAKYVGASPEVLAGIAKEREQTAIVLKQEKELFSLNEARKSAGGVGPISIDKIDKDILTFKERVDKLYRQITDVNMDYEAQRLEASGQFYAAEEIRINKRVMDQKAAYAKEVADTQQAYTEMQQKLDSGKKGSTPEAQQALEDLRTKLEGLKTVQGEYNSAVERAGQQTLSLGEQQRKLQGATDLAQINQQYAQLTGSMKEQYQTQVLLIEAQTQQKLKEASADVAGYREKIRELGDEQKRVADLMANGTWLEGFGQGIKEWNSQIGTAASNGKAAVDSLKSAIDSASSSLADMIVTGKMDASSFFQSLLSGLIKVQIQAMLTSAATSLLGSMGGGGIWSSLLGALGLGGSGSSALTSSDTSFASSFASSSSWFAGSLASGGNVNSGQWAIVGENGPEIFAPSTSGRILPNNQSLSGGSTRTGVQSMNFNPQFSFSVKDNTGAVSNMKQTGVQSQGNGKWLISMVIDGIRSNPNQRAAFQQALGGGM